MRNNGGGHVNHTMFWEMMAPGGAKEPTGALADAITKAFGGLAQFKEQFQKACVGRFGSGWGWLVADRSGGLAIESTPNQDTPLMERQAGRSWGATSGSTPTTSSTRTAAPTTWRRGGTSSTGPTSPAGSSERKGPDGP